MGRNDSWIDSVIEEHNKADSSLSNEEDTSTQEVEEQKQESTASASSQEESGEQESQTAQSETQTAQEKSESTSSENEKQSQENRDTQTEANSKEETSKADEGSEAQATQQEGEEGNDNFDQNAFFESLKTETENDPEFKKQLLESLGVEENSQPQFDNPELEQAYKFVNETGRSLQEYTFLQQLDTNKMDNEEAIRIQMTLDYPDLTQEDINELIDSKYNVDADEVGEQQAKLAKIQMKQDGSQALNKIKGYKEEWSKPVEGHDPNKKQKEGDNGLESVLGMDKDTFTKSLNEASNIDTLSVDLGKDGEFDFELKDGFSENFKKQYFSSDDPFKYYRNEDGSFDVNKIYLASLFFENADGMAKAIASKSKSEATEKVVKDKKNVNYKEEHKEPPQQDNVQEQNKEVLKRFGFK